MSGPAHEHEGQLGDRRVQAEAQQVAKRARRIDREDVLTLMQSEHFQRFIGKYILTALFEVLHTTNGGDLQKFEGRREMALKMLDELESQSPGAVEALLAARRHLEEDLVRQEPQKEEK